MQEKTKKILLSAYSCCPGKGSEPGVGWNVAFYMALEGVEVHVLTTNEYKNIILKEIQREDFPKNLHFHFYDIPFSKFVWKNPEGIFIRIHYSLWQKLAQKEVKRLHKLFNFTSAQHVTFVRYWSGSCLSNSKIPYIFGPVGGAEYTPKKLVNGLGRKAARFDKIRNFARFLGEHSLFTKKTIKNAKFILCTSKFTAERCAIIRKSNKNISILSEVGFKLKELIDLQNRQKEQKNSINFCSLGRLVPIKRIDIIIKAFHKANIDNSYLTIIGGGECEEELINLINQLGIRSKVKITGMLPRDEALRIMTNSDIMAHTCVHESGGWACLETMAAGLPVVCLDWGGPGAVVTEQTGFKISPNLSELEIVEQMAKHFVSLSDLKLRKQMSNNCKKHIADNFSIETRIKQYLVFHHDCVNN